MAKVLVIDDDPLACNSLMELARKMGHEAECALCIRDGLQKNTTGEFDVVFLDIRLPDGNGLDILPQLREHEASPEVIILTGLGDPDGAELAIRSGAWDYLQKPLSPKKIMLPLQRVLKYRSNLHESIASNFSVKRCGVIGNSSAIRQALEKLGTAAQSEASLLITGETGTGKELFARALHENSRRAQRPFVIVDCASIPSTLLESTLFGHVKGAFTGAENASKGLILEADRGTLFLDEIGEMPLELQKKLLRVLQEKKYRPVGGSQEVSSDFRLVAATHRDLISMSQKGVFRNDLLYRLGAMTIKLPSLRERRNDIEELVCSFTERICKKNSIIPKTFSTDCIEVLGRYEWPGNVRELANVIENAIVAASSCKEVFAKHLPERVRIATLKSSLTPREAGNDEFCMEKEIVSYKEFRQQVMEQADKDYFVRLMEIVDGDVEKACVVSELGKSRVYAQLKLHGIDKK
ncbi:sigma-54-dependent Fis family transcriptional regulator [Marinifilum sp. JC120]|nr:sigma-54-dependent Fis family transcriptional regulator [Marinifilum sp. JC120]